MFGVTVHIFAKSGLVLQVGRWVRVKSIFSLSGDSPLALLSSKTSFEFPEFIYSPVRSEVKNRLGPNLNSGNSKLTQEVGTESPPTKKLGLRALFKREV